MHETEGQVLSWHGSCIIYILSWPWSLCIFYLFGLGLGWKQTLWSFMMRSARQVHFWIFGKDWYKNNGKDKGHHDTAKYRDTTRARREEQIRWQRLRPLQKITTQRKRRQSQGQRPREIQKRTNLYVLSAFAGCIRHRLMVRVRVRVRRLQLSLYIYMHINLSVCLSVYLSAYV